MKQFRVLLTYVCVFVTLFTCVPIPVLASSVDTETTEETDDTEGSDGDSVSAVEEWRKTKDDVYNRIMSSTASAYYITVQPDSALYLTETIILNSSMLSPNYNKGVVDLPRLQTRYFYKLVGNSTFRLTDDLYPSIYWSEESKSTLVTLAICSEDTGQALWSCSITNNDLDGFDFKDNKWEFEDVSASVTSRFCSLDTIQLQEDNITLYPCSLHKTAVVMPNYIYSAFGDLYSTDAETNEVRISDVASTYERLTTNDKGTTITSDMKEYVQEFQQAESRPALLFQGSKLTDCTYDNNTGEAVTLTDNKDVTSLYYIIALNDKAYFGNITRDAIEPVDLTLTKPGQTVEGWDAFERHSLMGAEDYGPMNYIDWYDSVRTKGAFGPAIGKYTFYHESNSKVTGINVYGKTLMFSGAAAHIKNLTLNAQKHTVTINYYYQKPESGEWVDFEVNEYDASSFSSNDLAVLPPIENFTATAWYTSRELTELFTPTSIDTTQDTVISLYAGYTYTGGTYEVTFINTNTDEQNTVKYEVRQLPVLPEITNVENGYRFKRWDVHGYEDTRVPYDPSTFSPSAGKVYVFETVWDITGVITNVLADKLGYYVGDKIDKNHLRVVLTIDADGNTRELAPEEYTIFPETIEKEGTNQFYITYTETGSTAICELNGVAVVPIGIDATYTGGTMVVGEEVSRNMFDVTLNYNNKTTEKITNFTVTPTIISQAGDNKISIIYMNFSTSVTVRGITKEQESEQNKKLKSLTASYDGRTYVYVGDKVDPDDFIVTAIYSNNTRTVLTSKEFQYSPSKYKTAGENTITITFGGKTAKVKVNVRKDKDDGNSGNGGNSGGNSGGSESGGNNSGGNNSGGNNSGGNSGGSNSGGNTGGWSNNGGNSGSNSGGNSNNNGNNSNNNSNNNSGSSGNNSGSNPGNSGNQSNSSGNKDKGPSPGYLSAATILTNTMGNGSTGLTNDVDIMGEINKLSPDATSLDITLVNGASGNEINAQMLEAIKKKVITLNVTMVQPLDRSLVVGRWVIKGHELDSTENKIDPNITFEVTDKESDRLVFMIFSNSQYPKGVTATAYPAVESYGSGELVRLYTCNVSKKDSKLLQSFTWQDISNPVNADIYSELHYCLSNSANAYDDGSSLAEDKGEDWINVDVDNSDLDSDYENGEDDTEFDWDDYDTEESTVINPKDTSSKPEVKKTKPILIVMAIVFGVLIFAVIVGLILLLILRRKGNAGYADGTSDSEDDFYDDDDEFGDIPEMSDLDDDGIPDINDTHNN